MALDFPASPVDQQVYQNFYYDASIGAWRNVGSKNGLSTRVTSLETLTTALPIANGGSGTTLGPGGVPIVASSVSVNAGSASVSAAGVITFSGVTTLGLNGIFNANYENYRVVIYDYSASNTGTNQSFQLRAAGTTFTSNGYQWSGHRFCSWTDATIGGNGSGSWYLAEANLQSSAYYTSMVDVFSPFNASEYTRYVASSYLYGSYYGYSIAGGMVNVTTSFDGLTLNLNSVSSGTVKVYGFK
jgi:hypothetical protein